MHTNEFQKRGLPHSHILTWVAHNNPEFLTPLSGIDSVISAEIPDKNIDPLGHALVEEFMIHGPCGKYNPNSPCMKDGFCTKRYPKLFREETIIDEDGFTIYRRRDNGRTITKNGITLDNRWVVPHNLFLLKKYNAHINVEACNTYNLNKYLFKYVMKGPDCARHSLYATSPGDSSAGDTDHPENNDGIDEIEEYIKSRYLSACEAAWRLLGYEIHEKTPAVERLYVHLPGMNILTCHEEEDLQDILDNPDSQISMLTQWFVTNQNNSDARTLTYCEFPSKWTWNPDSKSWTRRKSKTPKIGRLRFIHPTNGEAFYLRMLLMVVKGAKSYEDVRTYQNVVYPTFREACKARGLIGDDSEWFALFDEAIIWATASQLRHLFMTVVAYCNISDVCLLFEKYWQYMTDDILHRIRRALQIYSYRPPPDQLKAMLYQELDLIFGKNGLSLLSYNLPIPTDTPTATSTNKLLMEELSYDRVALQADSNHMCSLLNEEQQHIFLEVMRSINEEKHFVYFVSGKY